MEKLCQIKKYIKISIIHFMNDFTERRKRMKFSQFGALPDFKSNTIPEDPSVRK
jgi:hypothetical protein